MQVLILILHEFKSLYCLSFLKVYIDDLFRMQDLIFILDSPLVFTCSFKLQQMRENLPNVSVIL